MKKRLTIKHNNRIVSSLWFYTVRLPSRHLGVIEEVFTKEGFRRQGLATKLLKRAISLGRKLKLDCIELTVREDKKYIQKFYKKYGFFDRLNRSYRLKL